VEGGPARECSQMRKIVVQVANNQGFTGVHDLQDSSSNALDKAKNRVKTAAFNAPTLGIIIPETFANPLSKIGYFPLIDEVGKLKNVRVVFCRVTGANLGSFKKIVAYLGDFRSWLTSFPDTKEGLNLNAKDVKESKPRNASAFDWGNEGSLAAEARFKKDFPGAPCLVVMNDLIFVRMVNGTWNKTDDFEEGCLVVSQGAFDNWQQLGTKAGVTFEQFAENGVIYKKQEQGQWVDATKGEAGALEVRAQTWELWNQMGNPNKISLEAFIENKPLWVKETPLYSGVWILVTEQEAGAIQVFTQVWEGWKNNPGRESLHSLINKEQRVFTAVEMEIKAIHVQLVNHSHPVVQHISEMISTLNVSDKASVDNVIEVVRNAQDFLKEDKVIAPELSSLLSLLVSVQKNLEQEHSNKHNPKSVGSTQESVAFNENYDPNAINLQNKLLKVRELAVGNEGLLKECDYIVQLIARVNSPKNKLIPVKEFNALVSQQLGEFIEKEKQGTLSLTELHGVVQKLVHQIQASLGSHTENTNTSGAMQKKVLSDRRHLEATSQEAMPLSPQTPHSESHS
ncbi:MAG: hypothetical protein ACHP6H_05880, partial [Legionellales bacterium]